MSTITAADLDTEITVAAAQKRIHALVEPVTQIESVGLRQALGRVTAAAVLSEVAVPNHTNAAMDGYALAAPATDAGTPRTLQVCGTALAGAPYTAPVAAGQCVRIMTGAILPHGCDSVVAQERVQRDGDSVTFPDAVRRGDNVRLAGEDLQLGDVAIAARLRLRAAQLGLAAALGITELRVFRKPRVAFFSNGDELRSLGRPLAAGEVYDSNRYTLYAMLAEMHVDWVDLGIVPDDPHALRQALLDGAACADLLITSAGASVGEADYIRQILRDIGEVEFCKVAIKPGRPLAFGKIGTTLFFGLPGNPVSVMVTFQVFVRYALKRLSGETFAAPLQLSVKCLSQLRKRAGRMEYQRGVLSVDAAGQSVVQSTGEQGSGILHSMAVANCYIVLPPAAVGVEVGEYVLVQPFGDWF